MRQREGRGAKELYVSDTLSRQVDIRSRARELAMQGLYQLEVQGNVLLDRLNEVLLESEADEATRKLAADWCRDAWAKVEACDELIEASTIKWRLSRLSPVDRSILRLSVFQLKFCCDVPPKVAINEAIELAKKFSTDKAPSFVNGVLDAILKKIEGEQE